ncbi:MAG: thiamine pyrophosphate-dependent enzyme, partial [Candidatus Caldarchaeum sp.]|nr:thiamine pyrophosphate-dependent enzyme [Candidatus Caldarchaeum sp.]MDW8436095.1 thiamine pyrophosphate-dependent enzyme [Candidatus Caldarchaeum sp.]
MFQALSPEGQQLVEPFPEEFLLVEMYRDMVMARVLDSWLMKLQRMGRVAIHAPSVGQEAVGVGTAYALDDGDWVFPLYRELPVYVARKIPIREILNRNFANSEDPLKGSDFAVYGNKAYRIVPAPIAVGLNISLAVGFSLALRIRGSDAVVLNYFGEGATSKGEFHEALNFAGVFKAPVVFVCTNNMYAISTHVSRQTAADSIAEKAVAYGIEGVRVDGNDVVACFLSAKKALQKARRGGGPTLIEAVTYRVGPHTTADDPSRYRDDDEVSGWTGKDPIRRLKILLLDRGLLTHQEDEKLWKTCEQQIKAVLEEC